MQTIERLQQHAKRIADGEHECVRPGQAIGFTDACVAGDCCRQGDLYLIIVDEVPSDYVAVAHPTLADKQLVPGNTDGAHHCLDAMAGVTLYRPQTWTEETLDGPCLVLGKQRKVIHPTHGVVTLLAGTTVLCVYQREWDKEEAKERRARD